MFVVAPFLLLPISGEWWLDFEKCSINKNQYYYYVSISPASYSVWHRSSSSGCSEQLSCVFTGVCVWDYFLDGCGDLWGFAYTYVWLGPTRHISPAQQWLASQLQQVYQFKGVSLTDGYCVWPRNSPVDNPLLNHSMQFLYQFKKEDLCLLVYADLQVISCTVYMYALAHANSLNSLG